MAKKGFTFSSEFFFFSIFIFSKVLSVWPFFFPSKIQPLSLPNQSSVDVFPSLFLYRKNKSAKWFLLFPFTRKVSQLILSRTCMQHRQSHLYSPWGEQALGGAEEGQSLKEIGSPSIYPYTRPISHSSSRPGIKYALNLSPQGRKARPAQ